MTYDVPHDGSTLPARVLEVRTGQAGSVIHRGRSVATAFRKTVREGPVLASVDGLEGDQQADRRVHGGPDKALCVYPVEHYEWWRERLGVELTHGWFGENLLVQGMVEVDVCLGDRYEIGEVQLEVSMSRRPCFKLGAIHDVPELPDLLQESGRTGYYLRVLVPGYVAAGLPVRQIGESVTTVSVAEVNRVMNVDKDDLVAAAALSTVPQVPERWRRSLARRLEGLQEEDEPRLRG